MAAGVQIFSTGGTKRHLETNGVLRLMWTEYTNFPEMMSGRLKTLHPKVHGSILCRRDDEADMNSAREYGIEPFELVVVNLYPFEATIAKPGVTDAEAIENIDIGGPTMVRAAKIIILSVLLRTLSNTIQFSNKFSKMGAGLFKCVAVWLVTHLLILPSYDAAMLVILLNMMELRLSQKQFLRTKLSSELLRENPHQRAALYVDPKYTGPSAVSARQLNGKELSYNKFLTLTRLYRWFAHSSVLLLRSCNTTILVALLLLILLAKPFVREWKGSTKRIWFYLGH